MKSKYNFIQVYNVWVNGRDIEDVDQHYPINNNVDRNWHSDFKLAYHDFYKAKVKNSDGDFGDYSEIYQDYIVTLFGFEVDPVDFERKYGIVFDLENDDCQELLPYYVDYDFYTIAERICNF